jgi:large conductance mechanosensitive channel
MLSHIKGLLNEFKAFAFQGNVMDLAIGLVIGSAFTKIVTSLVTNIMMPPLGVLMGGVDFSDKIIKLKTHIDPKTNVEVIDASLKYGVFINSIIDFLIVAASVFAIVKLINMAKRKPLPPDSTTKQCPYCLSTIALKASKCSQCTADLPVAA